MPGLNTKREVASSPVLLALPCVSILLVVDSLSRFPSVISGGPGISATCKVFAPVFEEDCTGMIVLVLLLPRGTETRLLIILVFSKH